MEVGRGPGYHVSVRGGQGLFVFSRKLPPWPASTNETARVASQEAVEVEVEIQPGSLAESEYYAELRSQQLLPWQAQRLLRELPIELAMAAPLAPLRGSAASVPSSTLPPDVAIALRSRSLQVRL